MSVTEDAVLAVLKERLDQFEAKLDKALDDHESRLRRLEAWSYALPPTFLVAVASLVAALVGRAG